MNVSVSKSEACDFEKSMCNFVQDATTSIQWKHVNRDKLNGNGKSGFPQYDHTTMTGRVASLSMTTPP